MAPSASSVFICLSVCPSSCRIPPAPEAQGNPARETPRSGEIVRQDLPKAEQFAAAPSQAGPQSSPNRGGSGAPLGMFRKKRKCARGEALAAARSRGRGNPPSPSREGCRLSRPALSLHRQGFPAPRHSLAGVTAARPAPAPAGGVGAAAAAF